VREIEARVHAELHDRTRGVDVALPRHHAEHPRFGIEEQIVLVREWIPVGKPLPFVPELKFTRGIASVRADFEHGDHDNLDLDGFGRGCRSRAERESAEEYGNDQSAPQVWHDVLKMPS
jgi:hypothetical protein